MVMKKDSKLTESQIQEMELFRQIQEDERNENEKPVPVDNRSLDEKINALNENTILITKDGNKTIKWIYNQ